MAWVAGVDGCPAGWFRAARERQSGRLHFSVIRDVADLLATSPRPAHLAIDMPIGLPERGPRPCDAEARRRIGPRRSSVFPAPVRGALGASSQSEATALTRAIDGRGVGAQAYRLVPKIRALDGLLSQSAEARRRIREAHPELSFWAWNGERPMRDSKRTPRGLRARRALVESWLGEGILERARGDARKRDLADDDILDAIACLWTAERIAAGVARSVPEGGDRDGRGLPMEMVY